MHLRQTSVSIDKLPWSKFVKRYDRKQTFFYLDPPYYKVPFYKHNLELNDYQGMAENPEKIKAYFILSIKDHPEIRKIFKGFNIKPVQIKYSPAQKKLTEGKEFLISNF